MLLDQSLIRNYAEQYHPLHTVPAPLRLIAALTHSHLHKSYPTTIMEKLIYLTHIFNIQNNLYSMMVGIYVPQQHHFSSPISRHKVLQIIVNFTSISA